MVSANDAPCRCLKQVVDLTVTEQLDQQHQEDLQRLKGFRLLDDDFLTKCFEGDPKYIQLVLRIVLEMPDLVAVDVRTYRPQTFYCCQKYTAQSCRAVVHRQSHHVQ